MALTNKFAPKIYVLTGTGLAGKYPGDILVVKIVCAFNRSVPTVRKSAQERICCHVAWPFRRDDL
jgi:hypothetical protein